MTTPSPYPSAATPAETSSRDQAAERLRCFSALGRIAVERTRRQHHCSRLQPLSRMGDLDRMRARQWYVRIAVALTRAGRAT